MQGSTGASAASSSVGERSARSGGSCCRLPSPRKDGRLLEANTSLSLLQAGAKAAENVGHRLAHPAFARSPDRLP